MIDYFPRIGGFMQDMPGWVTASARSVAGRRGAGAGAPTALRSSSPAAIPASWSCRSGPNRDTRRQARTAETLPHRQLLDRPRGRAARPNEEGDRQGLTEHNLAATGPYRVRLCGRGARRKNELRGGFWVEVCARRLLKWAWVDPRLQRKERIGRALMAATGEERAGGGAQSVARHVQFFRRGVLP